MEFTEEELQELEQFLINTKQIEKQQQEQNLQANAIIAQQLLHLVETEGKQEFDFQFNTGSTDERPLEDDAEDDNDESGTYSPELDFLAEEFGTIANIATINSTVPLNVSSTAASQFTSAFDYLPVEILSKSAFDPEAFYYDTNGRIIYAPVLLPSSQQQPEEETK